MTNKTHLLPELQRHDEKGMYSYDFVHLSSLLIKPTHRMSAWPMGFSVISTDTKQALSTATHVDS